MINPRSTSPHPSLSSSGSEEVRCSLDELDAVIATFDEEARQQCPTLAQLRNGTSTLINGQISQRRGSLSLETAHFPISSDSFDYASATLQNPRRNRSNLPSIQTAVEATTSDHSLLVQDDDFPPPPPDAFAPENFVLPPPSPPSPPPPPPLLSPHPALLCVTVDQSNESVAAFENGSANSPLNAVPDPSMEVRHPTPINGPVASTSFPVATCSPSPASVSGATARSTGARPNACRRPAVPQRAPSTRLSSVPVACNGTEDLRPRSAAVDSLVPVCESRGSAESLPNPTVQSPPSDRVSPEPRQTPGTESSIDQTVPPVSDIIRRFDRCDVVDGSSCRSATSQPKPTTNVIHEGVRMNPAPPEARSKSTVSSPVHNCAVPTTNSFGVTTPSAQPCTPNRGAPAAIPSPTVQELARGFTLCRSSSSTDASRLTVAVSRAAQPVRKITPPVLSPLTTGPPVAGKSSVFTDPPVPTRKLSSPGTGSFASPKPLTSDPRVNGLPGTSSLSSFGSVRSPPNHGLSRNSPPLPSPPPVHTMQSTFFPNRSNSIGPSLTDSPGSGLSAGHPTVSQPPLPPPPPSPPPPSAAHSITPIASPMGHVGNSLGETRPSGSAQDQRKPQLNPHVVHQLASALQQRRASMEMRSTSGPISVYAMRLDPSTLETLVQYNIVEAHQIPGYQPVPDGLPDWKTHKLERKNRDLADAYAADLRKWGCVPQWKRELIEKRQLGKTDSSTTRTNLIGSEPHPESPQSLISAELTEKLQRRLEKVAATAEP